MGWREKIKTVGGSKVAERMGVKYPTILRYIRPGSKTIPRRLSADLCEAMKVFLTKREYREFVESLSSEAIGSSVSGQ